MPYRRATPGKAAETPPKPRKIATTPEARENQLIAAAYDLAEKQIHEGTASSQVITQFLKLGSTRERLEQQRLSGENSLIKARIDMMDSQKKIEELYGAALDAMRSYSGQDPRDSSQDFED